MKRKKKADALRLLDEAANWISMAREALLEGDVDRAAGHANMGQTEASRAYSTLTSRS